MKYIKYIFLNLIIFAGLFSCSSKKEEVEEESTAFCINDTIMKRIKIDTVKFEQVLNQLNLNGKVTYDEDKISKIYPVVSGYVDELKVELGDYVQKGQVLAIIRSSEMADYESQYNTAKSALAVAEKNLKVTQDLFNSGLSSEKELASAKKDWQTATGELKKIEEIVRIYGVKENASYVIKSPINGFIVEKNVTPDMQFRVESTDHFFTISDLDEVWILADVYETDINKVKLGYEADVSTLADPTINFTGKIDKIFNVLDPQSRVMKVRIRIKNEQYLLKPNMFATVLIKNIEDQKMLAISPNCMIFDDNKNYVLVYKNSCSIEAREIKIGKAIEHKLYISEGVRENEKIIDGNTLLIYNALKN